MKDLVFLDAEGATVLELSLLCFHVNAPFTEEHPLDFQGSLERGVSVLDQGGTAQYKVKGSRVSMMGEGALHDYKFQTNVTHSILCRHSVMQMGEWTSC